MSNYGSAGYLNRSRDYLFSQGSPENNYRSCDRHPDDYNRYETARSRSRTLQRHRYEDERSRFSGYGDRPGSGVELMPTKWHGGEIITDPIRLPRSLKPRRLYYSPIGDGVVAADGVELKRNPEDSSPRISVTHTRTVDRGELGKDGYNLYARTAESDYGSDIGASGRNSRLTGGFSPGNDSFAQSGLSPGMSYGGRGSCYMGIESKEGYDDMEGQRSTGERADGATAGTPNIMRRNYNGNDNSSKDYYQGLTDASDTSNRVKQYDGKHSTVSPEQNADRHVIGIRRANGNSLHVNDGYVEKSCVTDHGNHKFPDNSPTACHDLHYTKSDSRESYCAARANSADLIHEFDGYDDNRFRNDAGTGLHISNNSEQPQKFEMSKDYLITNPRELIHQYATMTPVSVLEIPETSRTVKKMYSSTIEEKFIPYPPYKSSETAIHPQNFVRQLRDEGLTASQKEANRHRKPLVSNDPQTMQKIWGIRDETNRTISSNKEIDYLTERMVHSLQTGRTTPHF